MLNQFGPLFRGFWSELVSARPLQKSIIELDYAVLEFDGLDLSVVVTKADFNAYSGYKITVFCCQREELIVSLYHDFTFLNAEASGVAFDEALALDQLRLLMPRFGGEWHYGTLEEANDE